MKIDVKIGLAIPAYVRIGKLSARAEISNMRLVEKKGDNETLAFQIERSGNKSLRGHLTVTASGKKIGYLSALPVYLSTKQDT